MKSKIAGVAFVAAAVFTITGAAQAATVEVGGGAVSVNAGSGFVPVTGVVAAAQGDAVMVGAGGSAAIVYDDGCRQEVPAGETATVGAVSPCSTGGLLGLGTDGLIVGAAATAAVVGGVIAVSQSGDDNDASP